MTLRLMIVANGEMLWERKASSYKTVKFHLEQALLEFAARYPDGQVQLVVEVTA